MSKKKFDISDLPIIAKTARAFPKCGGSTLGKKMAYLTMSILHGGSKVALIEADAPVTGCRILENVDQTAYKFLGGKDVLIASFGDTPVRINISGMNLLAVISSSNTAGSIDSIPKLYNKYKLSANPKARFKIGISWAKNQASYECVLVGMSLDATARDVTDSGISEYSLEFIGVSRASTKS